MKIKTIVLPRNLFIINQVTLLSAEFFALAMFKRSQDKLHLATDEYNKLLLQTLRVMQYADKSVMPQELLDDIAVRTMDVLIDETSDDLDTPESEK